MKRPVCRGVRGSRGFSLIEMIAAILLLALAFTALLQVLGGASRLTSQAAQRDRAALLARGLLDSSFVLEPIHTGDSEGRFDQQYRWHMSVTQATPSGSGEQTPVQLYRLDVDVLWGQAPNERHARFSTLRAATPNLPGSPS